jgi:hypothetical protein
MCSPTLRTIALGPTKCDLIEHLRHLQLKIKQMQLETPVLPAPKECYGRRI